MKEQGVVYVLTNPCMPILLLLKYRLHLLH